jgi:hypothetical protein
VEHLYRDPFLQRFHSWHTGDIGFMTFEGFADSLRIPAPKRIQVLVHREQGNPRSSSPHFAAPCGVLGTALDVRLTERTAYFASIACASHNWLSGQMTLPWFKSSDFAAAESSV